MRNLDQKDKLLSFIQKSLVIIAGEPKASRISPADGLDEACMSLQEKKQAADLLRVDHAGEVCAQALYMGHALTAKNPEIKKQMLKAAEEEVDHLAWCASRLRELKDHVSYLNGVWYLGSFAIGAFSGLLGDRWNLGFVAETERQVESHLEEHLRRLPASDQRSKAILSQMKMDERAHAEEAMAAGGYAFPRMIKVGMKAVSKLMTVSSSYC